MKKAYLFDMDGVLVNNCGAHVVAWLEFARRHGGHLTKDDVIAWMGAPARDYLVRMFDAPLSDAQIAAFVKEKEALYREMYRPYLAPSDGLIPFLEQARANNVACAITTGGSLDNVKFVIDGLGIRDFFTCIVDSSQYERGKPAPDCYLRTAATVGVAPAECRVFEDAVNGIEAAQAADMDVYALVGTNSREVLSDAHPTRIFTSFAELL